MSGTDRSREPGWSPEGPYTILAEPQMGENIGAAARACWNFGLRRMRIVNPRDGWPNPKAVAMASGAGGLLDEAEVFATTADAVADLTHVYATTARPREMTKRVLTPEAAMREARARIADGERVGVLYGRERTGLENDDVVRANTIVTVPVNPAFGSLNLAQCVLLMGYEWRRQAESVPPEQLVMGKAVPALSGDVAIFLERLEAELEEARYFWPEQRRASMTVNLRNIFRRMMATDQDVRTLHGVIRALSEHRRRR